MQLKCKLDEEQKRLEQERARQEQEYAKMTAQLKEEQRKGRIDQLQLLARMEEEHALFEKQKKELERQIQGRYATCVRA